MIKPVSHIFGLEERKRVADAVARAEQKTSVEIVTVAATASARYDRGEGVFSFSVALAAVATVWLTCLVAVPQAVWEAWSGSLGALVAVMVTMITGFACGVFLVAMFPSLRLPFTPAHEVDEACQRAARSAFMSYRIRRTTGGTGLLLYISFFEHRVIVLPDDAVAQRLPPETWRDLCERIVSGIKAGSPTLALEEALARAGDVLGAALPRDEHDTDELRNDLVLID